MNFGRRFLWFFLATVKEHHQEHIFKCFRTLLPEFFREMRFWKFKENQKWKGKEAKESYPWYHRVTWTTRTYFQRFQRISRKLPFIMWKFGETCKYQFQSRNETHKRIWEDRSCYVRLWRLQLWSFVLEKIFPLEDYWKI